MAKLGNQAKRSTAKGNFAPPPPSRHSSISSTDADTLAKQQLQEFLIHVPQGEDNDSDNNDGNTRDTVPSPKARAGKQRGVENINKSSESPRVSVKATQQASSSFSSSSSPNFASSSSSRCEVNNNNNTTPISSPQQKRNTKDDTVVVPDSQEVQQPPTLHRHPRSLQVHPEDSMMDSKAKKPPPAGVHPAPASVNKRKASPPYKVVKPASKSRKPSPVLTGGKKSRFTEGSMGDRTSKVGPLEYLEDDDELRTVREFQKQKKKEKKKDKDKDKARDKDGAGGFGRKTWERMNSPIKDKENTVKRNPEVETGSEMPSAKEKSKMSLLGKFVAGSWKQPFVGAKEVKEIQTQEKSRPISPVKEDKVVDKKSHKKKKEKREKSMSQGDNGVDDNREEQTPANNGSKETRKREKSNSISPVKNAKKAVEEQTPASNGSKETRKREKSNSISPVKDAKKATEANKRYENLISHEDEKVQSGTTERQARVSASENNLRGLPRQATVPCVVIPTGPSKSPVPEKRSGLGFRTIAKSATKSAMSLHSKADKSGVNNKKVSNREDEKKKKLLMQLKDADTERERILTELGKLDGDHPPSDLDIGAQSLPGTPSEKSNRGVGKQGNGEKRLPRPPSASRAGSPLPENARSVRRAKSTGPPNPDSRKRKALISADIEDDDTYYRKVRQYDNDNDSDYVEKLGPNDDTTPRRQPKRLAKEACKVPQISGLEPPYISPRSSSRGLRYGSEDVVSITPGSRGFEDIPPVPELPSKPSKSAKKKKRERREKERNQDSDDDGDNGGVKWPSDCF